MANNLVFAKGSLFIDPDGDNIEVGEVQNISYESRDTTVKAKGKGLYPLAIEIAEREGTIRCEYLKFTAQAMAKMLGGAVTYANNKTTISVTNTSIPSAFKMQVDTPSDGSDLGLVFYKVHPMNFTIPLQLKEFSKPNCEFEIMEDEDGNVVDIILPGYQSVN